MTGQAGRPSEPELDDLIARDKQAALAALDEVRFEATVWRRVAAVERGQAAARAVGVVGGFRRHPVAYAGAALAVFVVALVLGWPRHHQPPVDPRMVAQALAHSPFYTAPDLDSPAAVATRRVAPDSECVVAWTVQAAIYRVRRSETPKPVESLERTIVAALAGAGPGKPTVWPDIDSAALARRIDAVRRGDVLLRAFGATP